MNQPIKERNNPTTYKKQRIMNKVQNKNNVLHQIDSRFTEIHGIRRERHRELWNCPQHVTIYKLPKQPARRIRRFINFYQIVDPPNL